MKIQKKFTTNLLRLKEPWYDKENSIKKQNWHFIQDMRCFFVAVTQQKLSFLCLIIYHFLKHGLSRACCVSNACTLDKAWDKKYSDR